MRHLTIYIRSLVAVVAVATSGGCQYLPDVGDLLPRPTAIATPTTPTATPPAPTATPPPVVTPPPSPTPTVAHHSPPVDVWLHADVSGWAETVDLHGVQVSGGQVCLRHTNAWPAVRIHGELVVGNTWVIVEQDGTRYAGTFEWLRAGQQCKPMSTVEGGHIKGPPLDTWQPTPGERLCFLVSAPARDATRTVLERSDVECTTWPGSAPPPSGDLEQCPIDGQPLGAGQAVRLRRSGDAVVATWQRQSTAYVRVYRGGAWSPEVEVSPSRGRLSLRPTRNHYPEHPAGTELDGRVYVQWRDAGAQALHISTLADGRWSDTLVPVTACGTSCGHIVQPVGYHDVATVGGVVATTWSRFDGHQICTAHVDGGQVVGVHQVTTDSGCTPDEPVDFPHFATDGTALHITYEWLGLPFAHVRHRTFQGAGWSGWTRLQDFRGPTGAHEPTINPATGRLEALLLGWSEPHFWGPIYHVVRHGNEVAVTPIYRGQIADDHAVEQLPVRPGFAIDAAGDRFVVMSRAGLDDVGHLIRQDGRRWQSPCAFAADVEDVAAVGLDDGALVVWGDGQRLRWAVVR